MPDAPVPFGPQTLIVEWDADWVDDVRRAIHKGTRTLEDVQMTILYEGPPSPRGGVWVALSLPRQRFLELMDRYADDNGTHQLSYVAQEYMWNLGYENGEPARPN
ncbi:MAG: hypothetical protein ABII76_13775 [Pseudomonadota bacterium]